MMDAAIARDLGNSLLELAREARENGDIVTAELLTAEARQYLDEAAREEQRKPRDSAS